MRYHSPDRIRDDHVNTTACTPDGFMIRRCLACATLFAPSMARCSACSADEFEHVPTGGTGSVVCWRTVECAANALVEPVPATIAIVELDEGPWVYTTIEGDLPQSGHHGIRVRFRAPPRGDRFPIFVVHPPAAAPAK